MGRRAVLSPADDGDSVRCRGVCSLHLLAEIEPRVRVFNLDTGYQFPETLELRDRIAERYGIEVEMVRAETRWLNTRGRTADRSTWRIPINAATIARSCRCGGRWWATTPGSRRSGRISRRIGRSAKVVGRDPKFGLVKINPLLTWTRRDVWAFIVDPSMYRTIRCTTRVMPRSAAGPARERWRVGEDERAGRWAGQAKTECGLHSLDSSQL